MLRAATVADAWRLVERGGALGAWLAASNTTIGEVRATRDARAAGERWASLTYPIRHALVARADARLDDITVVEGHPLALQQCAATLARVLPRAELRESVDGAWSAPRLRAGCAAVASARVGSARTRVLLDDITDAADNATTFELVTRPRRPSSSRSA